MSRYGFDWPPCKDPLKALMQFAVTLVVLAILFWLLVPTIQ